MSSGKPIMITIEQLHQIAEERGGKCLSDSFKHSRYKLLWGCEKGHQWEARPAQIKQGTWCPYCAKRVKRTIEEMKQIAKSLGGKCLSDTYTNNATKLTWKCSRGHEWQATPNSILKGTWCRKCIPLTRHMRRQQMQQSAK